MAGCAAGGLSNEYITIAKYDGVEVPAVEGLPEITDESVDNNIEHVREGFAEYNEVDREIREKDTVVIDYVTYVGGKIVDSEGAKGENYQLTVGNNSLFDGFDKNLIGLKKGDSFQLDNTFEDSYADKALAGKAAVLEVTIKKVFEAELPDLTDEFVQTISQESETVEEYREEMRALLEEQNEEYARTELLESVWAAVLEGTTVTEYPEDQVKAGVDEFYDYYKQGAEIYGMEFGEFLENLGTTEELFEEQATAAAQENVKQDLIVSLICEKEKITITDEEYEVAKEELAKEMSYASVEDMVDDVTEEKVRNYIMRDLVKEWLVDHCIQVKQ